MTDNSVTGRNQNHSDIRDESARDNDPLFELSRIFGFEEPVNQANLQHSPAETENFSQGNSQIASEISLERELMADFDAEFAADFTADLNVDYQDNQQQAYQPEFAEADYDTRSYSAIAPEQGMESPAAASVAAEPRFTGYAPLQRAYAEPAPETGHETDHESGYETGLDTGMTQDTQPAADIYYQPQSDFANDDQFAEPQQAGEQDYLAALQYETQPALQHETHYDFAPEPAFAPAAAEPEFETAFSAADFSDHVDFAAAGREPQAALSLEDELAFLLHDDQPALAGYGTTEPASAGYGATEPATASYGAAEAAQTGYTTPEPAPAISELFNPAPVAAAAPEPKPVDFAPLYDAPAAEVLPVATDFEAESAATDYRAQVIDDEFFAAPDLTHLPNRTSSYAYQDEPQQQDEPAEHSFSELFGASSGFAPQQAAADPLPEDGAAHSDHHNDMDFDFGDDFYQAETEVQHSEPEPELAAVPPLAHNAVRGFSSYVFGAATSPALNEPAAREPRNDYADAAPQLPADFASEFTSELSGELASGATAADAATSYDATVDDFFSNEDFDFSLTADDQDFDFAEHAAAEMDADTADFAEVSSYQPAHAAPVTSQPSYSAAKPQIPAPEVEAQIVAETKVEQTLALDLPEVSFGDDPKQTGLNSLESEFAEIFSTISVSEGTVPDSTAEADKAFEDILQDNFADYHASVKANADSVAANIAGQSANAAAKANDFGIEAAAAALAAAGGAAAMRGTAAQPAAQAGSQDDYYNHWAAQGAKANDFDTYNINEAFARDDEQDYQDYNETRENPLRKPALWASVAAAAVIVLGGGYYLLKSGGVVGGEPVVIHADTQPVKMQPENPGGAVVPNQDKAVYDQVSGTKPVAPEQKTLINTEEQPVDVGLLQGQDAEEDRVMADEESEAAMPSAGNDDAQRELITPRTVKTMVVRADGTIVESTAPAKPQAADSGLDEATRVISQAAVPERLGSDKPASAGQNAAAPRVVQTQSFTASGEPAPKPAPQQAAVATPAPPAPAPAPTTNAPAAAVTSSNAPAGTWFIQVASQPSAELAQKNYANLTSRYGAILGGRGVDIKKADIPGKGTYYRVRIPGGSKAEANALCERLKSAGGSCFPTL